MFQKIQVIGHVGSDPIQRETPTGKSVTNFTLAVNERFGQEERTTWYKVAAWNGLADVVSQYVHKGKLLFIEGRPSVESWTNDEGQSFARLVITAQELRLLSKAEPAGTAVDDIPV